MINFVDHSTYVIVCEIKDEVFNYTHARRGFFPKCFPIILGGNRESLDCSPRMLGKVREIPMSSPMIVSMFLLNVEKIHWRNHRKFPIVPKDYWRTFESFSNVSQWSLEKHCKFSRPRTCSCVHVRVREWLTSLIIQRTRSHTWMINFVDHQRTRFVCGIKAEGFNYTCTWRKGFQMFSKDRGK